MAQTISELEKERAELLKAIESQAQQFSSDRSSEDDSQEHTLKDWLNAAEEVMPSKPRKPTQSTPPPKRSNMNPKASFFGVIIMLTLLLTVIGVLYIGYTAIQKELAAVSAMNKDAVKELKVLKTTVTDIQQNMAAAGQGALFKQLQEKVAKLEAELAAIKNQKSAESILQEESTGVVSGADAPIDSAKLPSNVVTTEVLDAKLKEYTQGIEAKLERILMALPQASKGQLDSTPENKVPSSSSVSIAEPVAQQPKEPKVKPLDQPVVRLVEKVKKPNEPKDASAPLLNYSNDVKWLMNEPAFNYTLQLASMTERNSVQKMVDDKGLDGTRIIPQDRNGQTRFVLITGSYAKRQEADKAAAIYKADFGLTPWVRKIKDISAKVK